MARPASRTPQSIAPPSAEGFVQAWRDAFLKGLPASEVAAALRMSLEAFQKRASNYRRAGVKLPRLRRSMPPKKVDVAGLNRILEDCWKGTSEGSLPSGEGEE